MQEREKGRILIVDDDKANLDVLNHILKNEYTVYVAKTGEMAIRRAVTDQPDLILLDIIMPDMSGYEVLSELKERDSTRSIPVIFITGLSSVADEERGFLLGAVDYIVKPFNNSIVKARIRTHMKTLQQMRTIERLGTIDPLTEVANRRYFDEYLAVEWEKAILEEKSLGIISIDVDLFKQYNDTYGHLQGDVLLQTIAKVFFRHLRNENDIVARIGGEEFIFILPDTELEEATALAEEIRYAVEVMVIPNMGHLATHTTVSIGVAAKRPKEGDDVRELLELADKELYRAKDAGRNHVCSLGNAYG